MIRTVEAPTEMGFRHMIRCTRILGYLIHVHVIVDLCNNFIAN